MTAWNADVECSMGRPSKKAKVTMAHTDKMGVCVLSLMADQSWWNGIPPSLEKLQSILRTIHCPHVDSWSVVHGF